MENENFIVMSSRKINLNHATHRFSISSNIFETNNLARILKHKFLFLYI